MQNLASHCESCSRLKSVRNSSFSDIICLVDDIRFRGYPGAMVDLSESKPISSECYDKCMDSNDDIMKLRSLLNARVAGYEQALKVVRQKAQNEVLLRHETSSLAVNQAQINELKYVIEQLNNSLSRNG
jgi:hypothetical protein